MSWKEQVSAAGRKNKRHKITKPDGISMAMKGSKVQRLRRALESNAAGRKGPQPVHDKPRAPVPPGSVKDSTDMDTKRST